MRGGNLGEAINTKFRIGVYVGYVMSLVISAVDKNYVEGWNSGFPLYFVFGPHMSNVLPW